MPHKKTIKHQPELVEALTESKHKILHLKPSVFGTLLIVVGIVGLIASFALTMDKFHVLKNPEYQPICNINPILSCKSVMVSNQAEFLGVPNTIFGLIGFSMVIAIGAALLAGAKMHKRFWQLWLVGMAGGTVMMFYLMFQSIYRLETLCIFCMATWSVLLPMIWYSFLWALQHGYVPVHKKLERLVIFIRREHLSILILFYLIIIFLIVNQFWYFFKTL